jgi:hypothetical protein
LIGEVNSSDSAVSVNLNSKSLIEINLWLDFLPESFEVVGTISSSGEVSQIEVNLIPAFVELHGDGTNERLHSGVRLRRLVNL